MDRLRSEMEAKMREEAAAAEERMAGALREQREVLEGEASEAVEREGARCKAVIEESEHRVRGEMDAESRRSVPGRRHGAEHRVPSRLS